MEIYPLQCTERTSKFTYIGDCRRSIFHFVFFFNLESLNGKQSDNHTLASMLGLINYFLLIFFFLSTNKFIVEAQLAHLQVRWGSDVSLAERPKLRKMVD